MTARPDDSSSLLDLLRDAQIDDARSLMHEVTSHCGAEAVAALSRASKRDHELCRERMHLLHEQHLLSERDLATRLGYFYHKVPEPWQLLANVRALTIPDNLPGDLRPLLGKWLRAEGRLGEVGCVRCRSWIRTGEIIGWIELEAVRAGEPQRLSPEERFALDRLDTPCGLLKTVLKHANRKMCKYDLLSALE